MTGPSVPRIPQAGPPALPGGRCPRHVSRSVRDAHGRELGYLCLECGGLIARIDDHELLELAALRYLIRADAGELELGRRARRRLERIRRDARRRARTQEGRP